jgi:hypothetical protein
MLALGLGAAATAFAGEPEPLRAHQVRYHFSFHGLSGGDLQLTLKAGSEPGSWVYETRAFPSFLARMVVSGDSLERSWFKVTASGVEPERYQLDDGSDKHSDNSDLTYEWSRGRVVGTVRGGALDLPLEPGFQDVMTIRLAPVVDLLAGREPHEYAMLDGRDVKRYVYTRVGTERLQTELGALDTVVITSDRKGSDGKGRSWRYWYAPSKGWLPVRAEQREDGKARMTLTVRSLKWLDGVAPVSGDTH